MMDTDDTVLDSKHQLRPTARRNWVVWALIAALITLSASLVLACVRNVALQERAYRAEQVAEERAKEIGELTRQFGVAARNSLERLGDEQEPEAADDKDEDEKIPGIDAGNYYAGIDGSVPSKLERW